MKINYFFISKFQLQPFLLIPNKMSIKLKNLSMFIGVIKSDAFDGFIIIFLQRVEIKVYTRV